MEQIYPPIEELCTIETSLQCPETNCTAMFKCRSNLNLHLARHHGNKTYLKLLEKTSTQKVYQCPIKSCSYHKEKSFKKIKYLKQHYLKVHSIKTYQCNKCNQGFPTACLQQAHQEYCGINFKCLECSARYDCYDTLTTHGRRKGHKILQKVQYKAISNGDFNVCSRIVCLVEAKPERVIILPNDLLKVTNKTDEKQIDDENLKENKRKRKTSTKIEMQTQTQRFKAVQSTAGTQTEVVSLHSSKIQTPPQKATKKSIKTQTATVTSSSRACNTSFDFSFTPSNDTEVETNSLGTQTLTPNILSQVLSNDTCTTGSEDLLLQSYINETSFCNSNMETQTDWLTNLDLLSNDIQANNYTQTCDDILPPDLRFNNTHTQTVLNDILRSVGSQTNVRLNGGVFTNNETQTDSIFEELLQVINS